MPNGNPRTGPQGHVKPKGLLNAFIVGWGCGNEKARH